MAAQVGLVWCVDSVAVPDLKLSLVFSEGFYD